MSIFKAYDIRGIYGQDLTQDVFYKIARAYARFIEPRKVVVAFRRICAGACGRSGERG